MDCNVGFFLWNMTGDDKSDQDVLEQNGSQHDNKLWNVIDTNELDWDGKETEWITT